MKTAIVHDWLTGMRGGEKVLEVFCELFPEAPVFTLFHDRERTGSFINSRKVETSFLQNFPLWKKHYRNYLPLFPLAVEQFDLRDYDLVLSSSHCVAKGALAPSSACHICYCHTPLRYAWDMYREYFGARMNPLRKALVYPVTHYLRIWDACSSTRVDHFIANSEFVGGRIEKFYRRQSTVINPPVDTDFFRPGGGEGDYFLLVSALAPYKRVDIAVSAFSRNGLPLKIAGGGPLESRLKKRAGKNIEFLGEVPREELKSLYSGARAYVFPAEEDFGIAPVEAMASGTPVIGLGRGGLLETVVDGETGVLFSRQEPGSLMRAVEEFGRLKFDPQKLRAHALRLDRKIFKKKMENFIEEKLEEWTRKRNRRYSPRPLF